eukprot:10263984-Heterocapsa_arctica.AAC.1
MQHTRAEAAQQLASNAFPARSLRRPLPNVDNAWPSLKNKDCKRRLSHPSKSLQRFVRYLRPDG